MYIEDQNLTEQVWLAPDAGSFEAFKKTVTQKTDPSDWSFADAVEQNVLIYDGEKIRQTEKNIDDRRALMAEWNRAFRIGPGVVAIKGALAHNKTIDDATALFEQIIEKERLEGAGGGDHFAKPGANDRIWNAAEKHCLLSPENFAAYYNAVTIQMVSESWLGINYQLTAQLNRVNPGGAAQTPHRDYHLGFMAPEKIVTYPSQVHQLSPMLTLQGAIAHCNMPVESGPTLYLPYSQMFHEGYVAFGRDEYQNYFKENHCQLALEKGDAVFFNPALMHGAGHNISKNILRTANLLQVSSAFGRAIETVDRAAMCKAVYPVLLSGKYSQEECYTIIANCAEGYPFPTNLDRDLPTDGLNPKSQAQIMRDAISQNASIENLNQQIDSQIVRRQSR